MKALLSLALAAVITTAAGGWNYLGVVATAPGELVKILERAR